MPVMVGYAVRDLGVEVANKKHVIKQLVRIFIGGLH